MNPVPPYLPSPTLADPRNSDEQTVCLSESPPAISFHQRDISIITPHLRPRQNLEKCRFDLEKTWNVVITKKWEPCIHKSVLKWIYCYLFLKYKSKCTEKSLVWVNWFAMKQLKRSNISWLFWFYKQFMFVICDENNQKPRKLSVLISTFCLWSLECQLWLAQK